MLYIAGSYLGGSNDTQRSFGTVERIDFRENNTKWGVVWDTKTMHSIFFAGRDDASTRALFTIPCSKTVVVQNFKRY